MNPILLIQATAQAVGADGVEGEMAAESIKLFDLMLKGGWIMIPLALLSVISIWIFLERYFVLRRVSVEDLTFMNRIKDYIHDGKIDSALALCRSNSHPISRMIEKSQQPHWATIERCEYSY